MHARTLLRTLALLLLASTLNPLAADDEAAMEISYFNQIRPIFQAHCQGCHQPAKDSGQYVMTSFQQMLSGGESEMPAVVPGKPEGSYLIEQITPTDGEAMMPQGKPPLAEAEIDLIRRWIAAGAKDDSPPTSATHFDQDHPPVYSRPPVITAIDYSPDGKLLAVAGFHEVLLVNADSGEQVARLIGLSERIESIRFSPDGSQLVATGGLPARTGEVQVWDVESRTLKLSVPITFDTVYGGSWSPDGKLIAFGCADNTLRAIDAETGEQLLYQGAHDDWVRDTVFSKEGTHLVSVGRDMSCKLTEIATQRFVDNVTSITPNALKGGISSVARHPERDEIVIGGSDGVPKVYRLFRLTARRIGDDANLIRRMPAMTGRIFGVAVSRDGKRIAAVSSLDGVGQVSVFSYEFDTSLPDDIKAIMSKTVQQRSAEENKKLDEYHVKDVRQVSSLEVPETSIYAVAFQPDGRVVAAAGADGGVRLIEAESGKLLKTIQPVKEIATSPQQAAEQAPDFIRDVAPVLSRLGCNQGTCHGSAKGKNGFKLSLRGYDPVTDVRALTDDLASRRVNLASPDDSLMLLKPTGAVPHEGAQVVSKDHPYFQLIRGWIAGGAKLDLSTPRVTQIEVLPLKPVLQNIGDGVPMQVKATYADGTTRDVTREAFIESGNTEVATVDRDAVMTAVRRGEAAVLARYEGAYAATTLTVMGDREGFQWQPPETWGRVDELAAAKWERMKILPSPLCSDADFIRRVHLDLTGLPPTADQVRQFLADPRPAREKRAEVVESLIGSDAFVDYWTNKWADLLQVNRKFLGAEGAADFRKWIRGELAANTPYDEFVRKIIEAQGSNKENPAASYYKVLREPQDIMENTTHLFLAVRFNCNKCHDHPFERWTQDQYYETAAYFARVGLKADPASGKQRIGGTAVEGAKPLYEVVYDKSEGEVKHDRTGQVTPPEFPFECSYESPDESTRRQELAAWITSPDNPYFARSYVNRLWGYLLGVGIIEPIDDIRAGNPPTNPELLDYLTQEFIEHDFDVRHVMRLICNSRTYQLSVETNRWNADDSLNYSHATARRLPAEVLYDAIHTVTGSQSKIPGVPPGTRAAALPDVGIKLPDGFLANLGRPPRESACECERSSELQLGPIMALVSGPTVGNAISDPENDIVRLVGELSDNEALVDELMLRILNRPARPEEVQAVEDLIQAIEADHKQLQAELEKREAWWAEEKPKRVEARQQDLAQAERDLQAYQQEIAPRIEEQKKEREAETAQLEAALKEYEEKNVGPALAKWEKQNANSIDWHLLAPSSLSASGKMKLQRLEDRSIRPSGDDKKAVYTVTARTAMRNIQGFRLEALPVEGIPGGGPGLPPNGNFVVTEWEVFAAPASKPTEFKKVALTGGQADFTQAGFNIGQALDGNTGNQQGWAVHPAGGAVHWATAEVKEPLALDEDVVLKFVIHQQHNAERHVLGRFRLSATAADKGFGLGLPESLQAVVSTEEKERSEDQKKLLADYFRTIDEELRKKQQAVAESKQPLPEDPGVTQRKALVAELKKPLPDDAKLVQLRADIEQSKTQLDNRRLTAAQDLAWALINSPAFLFNR